MDIKVKLNELIDIRVNEIAMIRKSIYIQKSNNLRNIMEKYSIVMFYSLWEGFFCESLGLYIEYINQRNISIFDFHERLLAYCISNTMELEKNVTDFNKHIVLSKNLLQIANNGFINIPKKIDVKSNTTVKVMNNILKKLCVVGINEKKSDEFNLLLMKRNSIAHGDFENSYVDNRIILKLSELIINSMDEMTENILEAINKSSYIKVIN
ncbi:MAE_28990/MAE_18760 family HEPN-like nuclease [Herpetosiphon sp. NSE202]|uniref:MAE_28990/MAE_18760 family HEPN-like nuclease n=1 Tax=Herpetosiphon sp. NSE202 TaxID=3351349 RepID=UPI003635E47D